MRWNWAGGRMGMERAYFGVGIELGRKWGWGRIGLGRKWGWSGRGMGWGWNEMGIGCWDPVLGSIGPCL